MLYIGHLLYIGKVLLHLFSICICVTDFAFSLSSSHEESLGNDLHLLLFTICLHLRRFIVGVNFT